MALFVPQAWISDYAVNIDGEVEFDVTEKILAMPKAEALAMRDDQDATDELARDAGLLEQHSGPFYVAVEMAIAEYFSGDAATTQPEDPKGNRVGLGTTDCIYCENKDCNFDCDESQAGGFGSISAPRTQEAPCA
jgi:hypothetical protein